MVPRLMPTGAPAAIAMRYELSGENYGIVSPCATGRHAIGVAYETIRSGRADLMLAGGTKPR